MKCRKCGADIPFDQDICPICHTPEEQYEKKKPRSLKKSLIKYGVILAVIAIVVILFVMAVNNGISKDVVIFKVNGVNVTRSTYNMILIETAIDFRNQQMPQESTDNMTDEQKTAYFDKLDKFWDNPIDGKMPFDLVKGQAADMVKAYAYYKIEAGKAGLQMTKEERQAFESLVESDMTSAGASVDNNDPDKYYIDTFGVTRDQYMNYRVEQAVSEKLFDMKSSELNVTDAELEGQFENSRVLYATNTVDNVFLSLKDNAGKPVSDTVKAEKKNLADQIKNMVAAGDNFTNLAAQYSEVPGKEINNGRYVINKDSIAKQIFGQEFIDWSLKANPNDVAVVESPEGFNIAKCIEVSGMKENIDNLTSDVKQLKYHNIVEQVISQKVYEPRVVNNKVYDEIKKVPGNLVY